MPKLTEDQRRLTIRSAAARVATSDGLEQVTHGSVAKRCVVQTSTGTVRRLYPLKSDLWRAAIEADETGKLKIAAAELGFE